MPWTRCLKLLVRIQGAVVILTGRSRMYGLESGVKSAKTSHLGSQTVIKLENDKPVCILGTGEKGRARR